MTRSVVPWYESNVSHCHHDNPINHLIKVPNTLEYIAQALKFIPVAHPTGL